MHTYTPDDLVRAKTYGFVILSASSNGVAFTEWLESPEGMGFALFREPNHSDEDMARAKRWIRNNRDATVIYVYKPAKE